MTFDFIDGVPPIAERRIRIEVRPAAERALRAGHPWLFAEAITGQNRDGAPGDLAVIVDRKKRFLAVGLYDPASPIRVKVLAANDPAPINDAWFADRIAAALARRSALNTPTTDGYRLIHGENDGLPALVLDRYAGTLVLKLYSAAWLPHLRNVLPILIAQHPADSLVLRMSRAMQREATHGLHDGALLHGALRDDEVRFHENGLTLGADVVRGHKTGFFFDQRENRARVGAMSDGADVLDVFAYSGGFSLYAAAGGARSVLSVDVSQPALDAAQEHFALNRGQAAVNACQHEGIAGDAFATMEALRHDGRRFDLVIVDPPSFAKRSAEIGRALNAYERLARLAAPLVRADGVLVMASCSSRVHADAFFKAVRGGVGRPCVEMARTFHALDHPIGFAEGAYLKCLYLHLP
ncbi:MAG: class I SAM-dependent rRNA methyltransferase [Anaerolineaceae bacterium]|nr:MAG: class I SAM-dependent rRNA methyltransferase [Anaerolineaceae bacterium]